MIKVGDLLEINPGIPAITLYTVPKQSTYYKKDGPVERVFFRKENLVFLYLGAERQHKKYPLCRAEHMVMIDSQILFATGIKGWNTSELEILFKKVEYEI